MTKQKYSKIFILIFIILIFITFFYIVLSGYINDPLQIYHRPFFRKIEYSNAMRESALARIKNSNFDSVIVGNSYSENISSKKASEIFGNKFINLSMTGSNASEKNLLLNYIFSKYDVKNVIYYMDIIYFLNPKATINQPFDNGINNWKALYDDNPYNDYQVYLSAKYFTCNIMFNSKCLDKIYNIDEANSWEKVETHYRRFGGFKNWLKYYDDPQIDADFKTLIETPNKINTIPLEDSYKENLKKYLDNSIFEIVKNNPNTNFYFIIAPETDLALAEEIRKDTFEKKSFAWKYIVAQNTKYKNSKLFAFDDNDNITKIENFKDKYHYKNWINYHILQSIKNNENFLNETNIDNYIDKIYKKAVNVNFEEYTKLIKENPYKK